jgi:hypothetical protein
VTLLVLASKQLMLLVAFLVKLTEPDGCSDGSKIEGPSGRPFFTFNATARFYFFNHDDKCTVVDTMKQKKSVRSCGEGRIKSISAVPQTRISEKLTFFPDEEKMRVCMCRCLMLFYDFFPCLRDLDTGRKVTWKSH